MTKTILWGYFLLMVLPIFAQKNNLITPFEQDSNQTATYRQGIDFYKKLQEAFPKNVNLVENAITDAGLPLHSVVVSKDRTFTPEAAKIDRKIVVFINNAIHAGEPEGVDASMMLARDVIEKRELNNFLDKVVLVIIPFYNIEGALNRNNSTRSNQEGPESYGFRGNGKNLDLNRDFAKCDSRNARAFHQLFSYWQPEIFIDNHTSNGSDFQYTFTLISSQHNKLHPELGNYQQQKFLPQLQEKMLFSPYVNFDGKIENGIVGFMDSPRYSTGYATLHNTIGFVPETHSLKPFPRRTWATYDFLKNTLAIVNKDADEIRQNRIKADRATAQQGVFDLQWQLDTLRADTILFKGYTAKTKVSEVSGLPRLYYDRNEPYEKWIPFYNYYMPTLSITKPNAYIIPKAYQEIIERLKWNNVELWELLNDEYLDAEFYTIEKYQSSDRPYEGHHLNRKVEVSKKSISKYFEKGDVVVFLNQYANRYIIEMLEPQGSDSFFAWNFFDGILDQKEYYSDYHFEDIAADILAKNPSIKQQLEDKRTKDPIFAASASAQLDFIYYRSKYYEPTHRLYPVARMEKNVNQLGVKKILDSKK